MKMKRVIDNEKGFALLTAFLLGVLSLGLITMAFYMLFASTRLGGVAKRYSVQLDAAKGVSGYVMAQIRNDNLTCATGATCTVNATASSAPPFTCDAAAQIDLNPLICTALNKTNACTGLSACYLSEDLTDTDLLTTLYSVRITSLNSTGEQAIVDFVYRTTF